MWNVIAFLAVVASASNVIPQIVRSWRLKRTRDLSYWMLVIIGSGNVLWIAHGMHIADAAIVAANGILLISVIILSIMKYQYDHQSNSYQADSKTG